MGALGSVWLAIVLAARLEWAPLSLIDLVALFGVAVVLPLSLGGRAWWWVAAAGGALASFLVPTGTAGAGLLVAPVVLATAATAGATLEASRPGARSRRDGRPRLTDRAAAVLASVYAVVAAGALTQSRLGLTLAGLGEPIVELTAVHYIFAGTAALTLARLTLADAPGRWQGASVAAVVLTAAAPPVVAAGFVARSAVAQVGGAVLMTLGVWLTATLHVRAAVGGHRGPAQSSLLAVSGLAVWAPMALAVAWAAGQHWRVPALSVDDMARTHGLANAFAFALCGLLARRLEQAGPSRPVGSPPSAGGDGSGPGRGPGLGEVGA